MSVWCGPPQPRHLEARLQAGLEQRQRGYRGRFAPSPTGALHRGNLRTALLSWLDARLQGGEWLLRIDDLDTPRNRPGAEEALLADLRWLGLGWDGPVHRQSAQRGVYASLLSALRRAGALYPCRCSRRLLADISAPHGALAVYPGFCRDQAPFWGPARAASTVAAPQTGQPPQSGQRGQLPSWRLRLPSTSLRWPERFHPPGALDGPRQVGDPVLRRADGVLAYHLATAVDEIALGISDVLRGDDLWSSTGAQVAVIEALGLTPPRYGHLPLWRDAEGRRLSKREGAEGVEGYRGRGLDGPAVVGELAASLALVPPGSRLSAAELVEQLRPGPLERWLLPQPAAQPGRSEGDATGAQQARI
jgi:glutamyl-tRNA synthetase